MTAPTSQLAERRSLIGLDLLRFMAALLVVIYHFGHRAWAPPIQEASIRRLIPDAPRFPELEPVAWLGWVGVEIFFVISGFVIANSAERASPFKFLRSRILRLTPAIWVCATITLVVLFLINGVTGPNLERWFRTMALPFFPKAPWVDSVYWTLIVEFVFYGVIFLVLLVNRFAQIGLIAMTLGLVSSAAWLANAILGQGDWFLSTWTAQVLLIRHGCFFAAGVLTWLILYKRPTLLRFAVLALCLAAGVLEVGALGREKAEVIGRPLPELAAQAFFLTGYACIVLSVLLDRQLKGLVGARVAIFPLLGLMTYPLYLVHNIVGVALLTWITERGMQRHLAIIAATAAVVAVAWLVCRRAEPWIADRLRKPLGYLHDMGESRRGLGWLFRPTAAVP